MMHSGFLKSLKKSAKKIPPQPGVYIMKDSAGTVLYVGKAENLNKRVLSYFRNDLLSPRHLALLSEIRKISFQTTRSEKEALILENELIKYFRPKYNIQLRDDKTYPFLKLTLGEAAPRLEIARKKEADGSRYWGPFPDASSLKQFTKLLGRIFPLAKCRPSKFRRLARMDNPAACFYMHLGQCMGPCGARSDRDAYGRMVQDVIRFIDRGGKNLIKKWENDMKVSIVNLEFEKAEFFRKRIRAFSDVFDRVSLRGIEEEKYAVLDRAGGGSIELARLLNLPVPPRKIEGIDISNLSGEELAGSVVVFEKEKRSLREYRHFRIRGVAGPDDPAMIHEVVRRRFARLMEDKDFPDMLLVDGGKAQTGAARRALHELGINNFPIVGLAKKEEKIYLLDRTRPLSLPRRSPALKLLQRIRDEAHRFAHSYHNSLRKRNFLFSKKEE